MPNKSRFIIAESSIKNYFKNGQRKVYSKMDIEKIFLQNRILWNLPDYMHIDKFIERLLKSDILTLKEISFEGYLLDKDRYVSGEYSIYQLAVSIINRSYLSHFTAAFLNGLTNQVPKTIYITFEQSVKRKKNSELEQTGIDNAFSKPQRKSHTKSICDGYTFLIHNGMYSNRIGVYSINDIPVTNIERTLIDITVRPNYAGGVSSVLEIYRNAIDKISINKMVAILNNLNFIYPYQQAIGFYLERAGFKGDKLEDFHKMISKYDFYLTNEIKEKEYSSYWKIYYPKGI